MHRQTGADDGVFLRFLRQDRNGERPGRQFPSFRRLQLLHIVLPVRVLPGKHQPPVRIRRAGGHQRTGRENAAVIGNVGGIEQTEYKALAGDGNDSLTNAMLIFHRLHGFLILGQRNFSRQIFIGQLCADFYHRGVGIRSIQRDLMRRVIQRIPFGRVNFHQHIPSQRQKPGGCRPIRSGGEGFHQLALFKPDSAVPAGDGFRRSKLKHRPRQIPFFVYGAVRLVPVSIRRHLEPGEPRPLLFKQNPPLDRLVGDFHVDLVRFSGRVAVLPYEHRQRLLADEIAFRGCDFLNEVQAPGERFGQCHTAGFVGNKCVGLLQGGIGDGLGNKLSRLVSELEGDAGKRDGLSCFAVRLHQAQAVADGPVGERQGRRVEDILGPVDLKEDRALELIPRRALCLFQHIDAVGQGFGFRVAVFIRHQPVALQRAGVLVRPCLAKIHEKLRARLRRLHAVRVGIVAHASEQFDNGLRAHLNAVGNYAFIGNDGFHGLPGSVACINRNSRIAFLIPHRRRKLHNLIHARPERIRGYGSILTRRGQGINDHSALFIDHVALPVGDVLRREHAEDRARQLAVAARAGRIRGLPGVFVRIALVQLQPDPHRLVGHGQVGGFIRLYHRVQRNLLKHIPRRFSVLPNDVTPLAQRFGYGNAVFVRYHAADQRRAILIVFVNIKAHALDGVAVQAVGLGDADVPLCWLVLNLDLAGPATVPNLGFGFKANVHIVPRYFGFLDAVSSPGKPAGFGNAACSRDDDHAAAHAGCACGSRQTSDGELRSGQRLPCQAVPFHNADLARDLRVGKARMGRAARRDGDALLARNGYEIPFRGALFPDGVHARLEVLKARHAVRAGGLRCNDGVSADQLKHRARQRRAGGGGRLGDGCRAQGHIEGDGHGLELVGRAVLRDEHLLDGYVRYAYQKARLLLVGRNRFGHKAEVGPRRGDGHRVPAVEVVVGFILPGGVSGQSPIGPADTNEVRVRGKGDGAGQGAA